MSDIAFFEAMSVVSGRMVDAARANEWERLVVLEREMAVIRAELMRGEPGGNQPVDLSKAEATRKASLIEAIIADDLEVRRHVEPWLASARKLLAGTQRDRAVRVAYGVSGA
jgi:flagellar protein FliT